MDDGLGNACDIADGKLAELKKETSERAASNPARYTKFSDRVKELIEQFNKELVVLVELD